MNLQDFNNLKNDFNVMFLKNNYGEFMSYKEDLNKILNDFNLAQEVKLENKTEEELINLKEELKTNLDIQKIKEIDKEIEKIKLNKKIDL